MEIVRCVSCDGYGWFNDEETECDWCGGTGYVYRDERGVDHRIPDSDYGKVADQLEKMEMDRMRDLGYTGTARHPDEQPIRKQNKDE